MKIVNIPSDLTQQDVDRWIGKIEQSLNAIFGSRFLSNFIDELRYAYDGYTLEFSNDEPPLEEDEPITLSEAKADLLNILATRPDNAEGDEFIKDLIQRIEEAETAGQLHECASAIAESCASSRGDYPRIMEAIEDLLGRTIAVGQSNRLFTLGCYFHDKKKIVLYVKAISPNGTAAGLPLFEEVFAHETFHAYHYYACEHASQDPFFQELPCRKDYTSRVVKESLAAFFEFYYCGRNGIATDIDMDWRRNEVTSYPYSGARYLSLPGSGVSASPLDVFEASLRDADKALRLLLEADMDAFYDVKNVERLRIKAVTKRVPVTAAPPALGATITVQAIEAALQTMGRGWFILKYAEDYRGMRSPIPLDYGDPNSFVTRMRTYWDKKPFHGEIIRYLKRGRLDSRVRAGAGAGIVCYKELQDILDRL